MDTDLTVALVAGVAAVGSAIFTALTASHQSRARATTDRELERLRHELSAALRREDRSLEARAVVDRFRRPLLATAVQLLRRIENIRGRDFLVYLAVDGHRADVALQSTLYRFAAYLGWRESLHRELTYLNFEDGDQTKEVLLVLDEVRAKLASSRLDVEHGRPRMMLWTDEQSAIGGLMLREDSSPGIVGFETFFDRYQDTFSMWMDSFASDLCREGVEASGRLDAIAAALKDLIRRLDVEGVYGETPEHAGSSYRDR